ncbi:S8 family serine peptidase [Alkaliphilus sp. B6464]|uniref:S8 family serine peptidase n=1 Tax=Alkaliphilus sp. B6464 TaxID=2731219 RepID=UPI001BADA679|nr:S8 family serine peptidase [Alkaliphilus sp. B6464]QUH20170.1 S8 family serine peptidase [Alkaliphilus sp. B6464]
MKRFLCLFIVMVILLVGCTPSKAIQTKSSESSEPSESSVLYKTMLSPDNKLSIVRKPNAADYSFIHPGKMTELPSYNPNSGQMWQVDLRSSDLTNLDLSEKLDDLLYADFDSKTKWPNKLPYGFEPQMIMELGKNPGLRLRELHKKGITGKGIGLAIIDQGLLVDHMEYKEQLKMYEEIHCSDENASMHGPAVASIAVGKTVGVAPEADLYYIAETHGVFNEKGQFDLDLSWLAKSIDRIVEVNKTLPEGEKIRVISISLGIGGNANGYGKALESIKKAKQEGIYTVYVGSNQYMGLGRDPLKNADDITSFTKGEFWKKQEYNKYQLLIPMDSRCTASPTGVNDYVFYRKGGLSWSIPYVAGLYALACQVKPDITPDVFWEEAFNTSDTISADNSSKTTFGRIVNPVKLIEKIEKMK